MKRKVLHGVFFLCALVATSCKQNQRADHIPVIGFMDAFVDETMDQARQGFFQALADSGYAPEQGTLEVLYRNAQNDLSVLSQIADFFVGKKVDLIATCPSVSTITACKRTKDIPICMMVSPSPQKAQLVDDLGLPPANLFGVYEDTWYIDTSVALIKQIFPQAQRVGTLVNQSEPQSVLAMEQLKQSCRQLGLELVVLPVNNSAETHMVVEALIHKSIDVFFAPPDNTIFASFPIIVSATRSKQIPIISSEVGLVRMGALAAYGADFFAWGYQAGRQAAQFLRQRSLTGLQPELVRKRVKLFNAPLAAELGVSMPAGFQALP